MADTPSHDPVEDWATDFDHFDRRFVADPYPIYTELQQSCPVAHSDRYHGLNVLTAYDDVAAAAHDTETFSSRRIVVNDVPTDRRGEIMPPINLDPPHQAAPRRVLLPFFNPVNTASWEGPIRAICSRLLDAMEGRSTCDLAIDYARHLPGDLTAMMFGVPPTETDRFRLWIHDLLEIGPTEPDVARTTTAAILDYMKELLEERRANGGDDVITYLLDQAVDGEPLDDDTMVRMLFLLLLAGIDTTWSALGSSFLHLATHPEDRRRLVADPSLIPSATEEFLRAYSPVMVARLATEDTEINSCPIAEGEWVMLGYPAANRDPAAFEDPQEIRIDREQNRHAAFGLGVHRCLGSNLARLEMNIAIAMLLERFPEFALVEGADVAFAPGVVRGPRNVPVVVG